MDKADQGTGGAVVNVIAYQGDYVVAHEESQGDRRDGPRQELRCAAPALSVQWITAKAPMSDRHLTRIRQLTALRLLVAAIGMIGLAISGALKEAHSPVPQLASQK